MTRAQVITGVAVVAAVAVVALFFFIGNPFSMPQTSLVVQDEQQGTGAAAAPGDTLSVNYTGKLQDGTIFDTSIGRAPFSFVLGAGQVIQGWDQGLVGMKVGGKRLLIIPPSLGYGAQAMGPIPANSTLVFEVDLLSVAPKGQ
jgi:peptidylprolyl isomerase/FKBP-type peptidyl-prolyl cis-trans isomerase FkpA